MFTADRAQEVLSFFREWTRDLPDELTTLLAFLTAPPLPFVPEALHGRKVVAVVGCHSGEESAAVSVLQPVRALAPAVDMFGPMPYPALQSMLNDGAPAGILNYLKSGYIDALGDGAVQALAEGAARAESPLSAVHIHHMGGAVARVGEEDTAYSNRSAEFVYNILAVSPDPSVYSTDRQWVRDLAETMTPYGRGGAYVNFIADADDASATSAYGSKYQRLVGLKRRYDPDNLLRYNQNIAP
jgi:hypothetical protein